MTKEEQLRALEEKMRRDTALSLQESNLVFGEGDPDCAVMFIGEAPGYYENQLKRPFVGRAGKLLDELIRGIGWKREGVYITNIVKRRPPENRDPLPEEIKAYEPYLERQIEIVNPRVIAALGRFAMNYFLPEAKITRDNGRVFRVENRLVVPLFHTAAALRSPQVLKDLTAAFKRLPDITSGRYTETVRAAFPAKAPKTPPQAKLF